MTSIASDDEGLADWKGNLVQSLPPLAPFSETPANLNLFSEGHATSGRVFETASGLQIITPAGPVRGPIQNRRVLPRLFLILKQSQKSRTRTGQQSRMTRTMRTGNRDVLVQKYTASDPGFPVWNRFCSARLLTLSGPNTELLPKRYKQTYAGARVEAPECLLGQAAPEGEGYESSLGVPEGHQGGVH